MKKLLLAFSYLILTFSLFATTIYDIQYTTTAGPNGTYPSPLEGQEVTVSGIVTGENYNNDNKFFMCDPAGGPWTGIYVCDWQVGPALGDEVEVTGTVTEYYGWTELSNCTVTILSSGNDVPVPLPISTLDLAVPALAEQYESCLVSVSDVVVTAEQDQNGQWYIDDGSGDCQVDDGFFYLDSVIPPIVITIGMEWAMIIGCVDYSYDEYAINPRTPADLINLRNVVVELFTGQWCSNSPNAQEALHNLQLEYGSRFSYVEYHIADQLAIDENISIFNYYPSTGSVPFAVVNSNQLIINSAPSVQIVQDQIEAAIAGLLQQSPTAMLSNIQYSLTGNELFGSVQIDLDNCIQTDDLNLVAILLEDENEDYLNYNGEPHYNIVLKRAQFNLNSANLVVPFDFMLTDLDDLAPYYNGQLPDDLTLVLWLQTLTNPYDQQTCQIFNVIDYIIVNNPFSADFSGTPTSGLAPLQVQFTDLSTGNPTSWQWDFNNDGSIDSNEQNPIYTYTTTGNYSVSLTISNGINFDTETKIDYISVQGTNINGNLIPLITALYDNYPNPFNPSTTIEFSIQNDSKIELTIYNIKGQQVKQLLSNHLSAGQHSIIWNGDDDNNKTISTGIYLYKLNVNSRTEATKKCLLLK